MKGVNPELSLKERVRIVFALKNPLPQSSFNVSLSLVLSSTRSNLQLRANLNMSFPYLEGKALNYFLMYPMYHFLYLETPSYACAVFAVFALPPHVCLVLACPS